MGTVAIPQNINNAWVPTKQVWLIRINKKI